MKHSSLLAVGGLSLSLSMLPSISWSHYLWLERGTAGGNLYFGEYEGMLRETSPGRLDEMPAPEIRVATSAGATMPVAVTRKPTGFAFPSPSADAAVTAMESSYTVRDWTRSGLGTVKPMFYARLLTAQTKPIEAMTLDILRAEIAGKFRVVFRGAPLAGANVRIIAPNAWTREARTEADGEVRFDFPWRGQYILHVIHSERTAGTFKGIAYDTVRHRATATLYVTEGAETRTPTDWRASRPH